MDYGDSDDDGHIESFCLFLGLKVLGEEITTISLRNFMILCWYESSLILCKIQ